MSHVATIHHAIWFQPYMDKSTPLRAINRERGYALDHVNCSERLADRILFAYVAVAKLSLYSGVLALGVGDSMAALCGKLFGKTRWPGVY